MHLDAYLAETRQLAERQSAVLDQAASRLEDGDTLNALEENGVLHALQVLTENAIGKAKHLLKLQGHTVPISAYDAFHQLIALGQLAKTDEPAWNAVIGLRNRIAHDYLNLDMSLGPVDVSSRPRRRPIGCRTRREERGWVIPNERRITQCCAQWTPSRWVARQRTPCSVAGLGKETTLACIPRLAWRPLAQQRGSR